MTKKYSIFFLLPLLVILFQGCKTTVDNRVSFNNSSSTNIVVNFRGQEIKVAAGQIAEVNEIPQGTYTYATNFTLPVGAISKTSFGDVTGTITIKAQTKILVFYTSTLLNGVFTLSATLSSSDDQSNPTTP